MVGGVAFGRTTSGTMVVRVGGGIPFTGTSLGVLIHFATCSFGGLSCHFFEGCGTCFFAIMFGYFHSCNGTRTIGASGTRLVRFRLRFWTHIRRFLVFVLYGNGWYLRRRLLGRTLISGGKGATKGTQGLKVFIYTSARGVVLHHSYHS